jgi:hypothetical protein
LRVQNAGTLCTMSGAGISSSLRLFCGKVPSTPAGTVCWLPCFTLFASRRGARQPRPNLKPPHLVLCSEATPLPDLCDAHAPVRLPSHRDSVLHRSRSQAGSESVAASLVGADALDLEVLTNLHTVNAVGELAIRARLLDPWTGRRAATRCSDCCRTRHRQLARQGRSRGRRSSCDDADHTQLMG